MGRFGNNNDDGYQFSTRTCKGYFYFHIGSAVPNVEYVEFGRRGEIM